MRFLVIILPLLFTNIIEARSSYSLSFLSESDRNEFSPYFSDFYLIEKDKKRLTLSANNKLKKIMIQNNKEIKDFSKLNLNLITWPSEDKLIYKYGEIILKDKK